MSNLLETLASECELGGARSDGHGGCISPIRTALLAGGASGSSIENGALGSGSEVSQLKGGG